MKTHRFGIIALALCAASASIAAQGGPPAPPQAGPGQRQQGAPPARGRGMQKGTIGMQRGGPASAILGRGAQLNLTDDQVKKLQSLQSSQKDAEVGQTTRMRLQADLMDATCGEGNLEAARSALDKMSRARNDAVIARMKSRKDARDVLTVAQRAQLDQMDNRARQGMRMRARGGMERRMGLGMRPGMQGNLRRDRVGPGARGPQIRGPQMRGQFRSPDMCGSQMRGPQMRNEFRGPGMRGPQLRNQPMRAPQFQRDGRGPERGPPGFAPRMRRGGPDGAEGFGGEMNRAPQPPRGVRPPTDSLPPDNTL